MTKTSWFLVAATVAGAAAGCGKSNCERVYDMELKCSDKGDKKGFPPKDAFMSMCSKASSSGEDKDELEGMFACAKESSCDAYKACGEKQRGKRAGKRVEKALADGKLKDAWDDCTIFPDYYKDDSYKATCVKVFKSDRSKMSADDQHMLTYSCSSSKEVAAVSPEFVAACKEIVTGELTSLTAAATKLRDTAGDSYEECSKLEMAADDAGPDAKKAAETLCKEVDLARDVKKGIADVQASVAAKKSDAPYQCTSTPDDLKTLGTPWALGKLDELLKACFVDLGKVTFEVEAANAEYSCPFQIERILEADSKFGLSAKYPDFAAAKATLPANCQKPATP